MKQENLKIPYNSDYVINIELLNYDIIESLVKVKQNEIFRVSSSTWYPIAIENFILISKNLHYPVLNASLPQNHCSEGKIAINTNLPF